jgi:hypothetical protein
MMYFRIVYGAHGQTRRLTHSLLIQRLDSKSVQHTLQYEFLSTHCILGDIRLWVGDTSTSSGLVSNHGYTGRLKTSHTPDSTPCVVLGATKMAQSQFTGKTRGTVVEARAPERPPEAGPEKEFFVDNLLVRIYFIIEMILVDRPCAMGV